MKAKSILLISLMCAWIVALTPARGASAGEVTELDEVRTQLAKVTQLIAAVDSVREWHRDGLNTRIDQLGIRLMTRLNEIAPRLLTAFESGTSARTELEELLEQSATLALQRIQILEQRAAAEREPLPKFEQNAQADIARAFIEDLTSMGKDYIEAYIRQAEIRRAAGLESEPMFQTARERPVTDHRAPDGTGSSGRHVAGRAALAAR